ncbi:hypothetical protein B0H10DRAFT_603340 [Mycena sp. CBHHK59/15]|nr:hypothetical protein B0H10DRAFT_603340 [Mycena sp. CBHHK59/15]
MRPCDRPRNVSAGGHWWARDNWWTRTNLTTMGRALDHVLEVEIVLANGTVTRASATQNPDILFAVKGAAASFGIVTEFVFLTHPEPPSAILYSYTLELGSHAAWPRRSLHGKPLSPTRLSTANSHPKSSCFSSA